MSKWRKTPDVDPDVKSAWTLEATFVTIDVWSFSKGEWLAKLSVGGTTWEKFWQNTNKEAIQKECVRDALNMLAAVKRELEDAL